MAVSIFPVSSTGDLSFLYRVVISDYVAGQSRDYSAVITRSFPAGVYTAQLINAGTTASTAIAFLTDADVVIISSSGTGSITASLPIVTNAAKVRVSLVGDPGSNTFFIAVNKISSEVPANEGSLSILSLIETSQTVTVTGNNTPYLIIGGGGGGGSAVFESWHGASGGGSGRIFTGTVNAGSYPLVIGAGGNGSSSTLNADTATNGGNTTFNGQTALGGNKAAGITAGNGGSGGGSSGGNGGFNGNNGLGNQTNGTGTGVTVPAPFNGYTALQPVAVSPFPNDNRKNPGRGGGFYAGGSGGHGSNNYALGQASPVNGTAGTRGGGGGAAGGGASNTGTTIGTGGAGGAGLLALISSFTF
jgi:hypothetical protein